MPKTIDRVDSSEDEGFSVGPPTISEIKEYFSTYQYYTAAESSDSSGELSESFVELLEKRKEEIRMENQPLFTTPSKYPIKRNTPVLVPETPEVDSTVVARAEETTFMSIPSKTLTDDDSFLAAEELCEQTALYNAYMKKDEPGLSPFREKVAFQDMSLPVDETLLNDVEPPSLLGEQTIMRMPTLTPQKYFGLNRPSTILEENTIASTECSFQTASEMRRSNPKTSLSSGVSGTSVASEDDQGTVSEENVIIELSDESSEETGSSEMSPAPVQCDEVTQSQYESLSGSQASSCKMEDDTASTSTFNMSREFNDTLEKVEYMMAKGEKLRQQQNTPQADFDFNSPTPTTSSSGGAIPKKTTPTSAAFRQPRIPSKIPQMRQKAGKFDYIKSPIAAYINKTPTVPLFKKNVPPKILIPGGKSPRAQMMDEYKENQAAATNTPPKTRIIPKKACISAPYAEVHDERNTPKFPGGPKMQKLLGDRADPHKTPIVVKSMGRYKTARLPPEVVEEERKKLQLVENSIADLSVMSGDVSVHVYKNAEKY